MSRKGSRQSIDAIASHTSSRKLSQASLDRLSNDSESQRMRKLSQDMFFNPLADSDVDLSPFLRKKEIATPKDNNQNIEMLELKEENLIEENHDNREGLGNGQQSSIDSAITNDSLNAETIGLQTEDSNRNENSSEDVDNNKGLSNIPQVPESEVAAPDSLDIETNGNNSAFKNLKKPNSDCAKDNNDSNCTDSLSKTSECSSSDITDTLPDEMSSSETEQDDTSRPDQNADENNDERGDAKINADEDGANSFEAQDLENSPNKTGTDYAKQSSDQSGFLSDVLNAMNDSVQEQGETEEDPNANSSSC